MSRRSDSIPAHGADRVPHMDAKQVALAAEVRAEMGRQNVKAAHIQRALGISSTAWGTYFVQCTRDVPITVVMAVADYLGVKTSELVLRAEQAYAHRPTDPITAELEAGLSKAGRRALEEGRRLVREERPGGADAVDPQRATRGKVRRSA
jgi:hypothetical protein